MVWLFKLMSCQAQVSGGHVLPPPAGKEEVDLSWVQTSQGNKSPGTSNTEKLQLFTKQIRRSTLCVYAYWICPSASINLPSATACL